MFCIDDPHTQPPDNRSPRSYVLQVRARSPSLLDRTFGLMSQNAQFPGAFPDTSPSPQLQNEDVTPLHDSTTTNQTIDDACTRLLEQLTHQEGNAAQQGSIIFELKVCRFNEIV